MHTLEKTCLVLNKILLAIAGILLCGMIFLTCANILFREMGMPIRGTYELMGYMCAVVIALSLGYTQSHKSHIAVDIVVQRFSKTIQKILGAVNNIVCMIFFSIAGWQIIRIGTNLMNTGETSETLRIVYYPFTYGTALGCFIIAFTIAVDFLMSITAKKETV